MTRSPLLLAALASSAVPGLDPATVEGANQRPGHQFEVAIVQDTQHRRWVVRAPVTPAAAAQMELTVALLVLLARRVPFALPTPKGFAPLKEGGRAAVYPYLAGRPISFAELPAGPGLAAEIGRTIGALHNVDRQLFDEAGLPSYDADTYRSRRLGDLDRAAATGLVPARLLARWESQLEDVSLWRFAPTPTHGDLTGDEVLAVFEDDQDASTGRVRGLTGWEDAKVADPADDFAALITQCSPDAFDSVLEAYAHTRVDRLDAALERRARLAGELQLVNALLTAVGSKEVESEDSEDVQECTAALHRLDDATAKDDAAHDRAARSMPAATPALIPRDEVGRELDDAPASAAGQPRESPSASEPTEVLALPDRASPADADPAADRSAGASAAHDSAAHDSAAHDSAAGGLDDSDSETHDPAPDPAHHRAPDSPADPAHHESDTHGDRQSEGDRGFGLRT